MYEPILLKIKKIIELILCLNNNPEVDVPEIEDKPSEPEVDDIILPLDESKQNDVPYISTYYIKPIVKPGEEVFIDFFIRDFWGTGIKNDDIDECIYKVIVKIEGQDNIILRNLKSGNHRVSLGVFEECKEQNFSIATIDNYGRHSHELFNFFLVQDENIDNEYIMTEQDLVDYNISNDNSVENVIVTREGLQKLLDDKQTEGYNRLKMLKGIYRIDHTGTIYIPTKFTLDMNESTIKLNGFAGDSAQMIALVDTFDSHVMNGTVEGDFYDHDYDNSSNNSEWVHGISIGAASKYSSVENMIIKDITGYGATNGISPNRNGEFEYTYLSLKDIANFTKVDIDRLTGEEKITSNRMTSDFYGTDGHENIGYLSINKYLGYQGVAGSSWNIICHYYDADKNFIESIDAYQYRRVRVPKNAKFIRVTVLGSSKPSGLSLQAFKIPTHCSFKNIRFENCRCVGLAQAAMNNMLVEDCEFINCGQNSAKCAYDAEDGWDMMQDVTFKRLNFHDNPVNDFLICAGHNFIVEDMLAGDLHVWGRTKDFVIRNSKCDSITTQSDAFLCHGIYRINNVECTNISLGDDVGRKLNVSGAVSGTIFDSKLTKWSNAETSFTRCEITVKPDVDGMINHINSSMYMKQCVIKPYKDYNGRYKLSFNDTKHGCDHNFIDCKFEGKVHLANHNYFYSANFKNCVFEDMDAEITVTANEHDNLIFENCKIGSSATEQLIKFGPFVYTAGDYNIIKFINSEINCPNVKSLLYGYATPTNAYIDILDCQFNTPNMKVIYDNYRYTESLIQEMKINIKNSNVSCEVVAAGLEKHNILVERNAQNVKYANK